MIFVVNQAANIQFAIQSHAFQRAHISWFVAGFRSGFAEQIVQIQLVRIQVKFNVFLVKPRYINVARQFAVRHGQAKFAVGEFFFNVGMRGQIKRAFHAAVGQTWVFYV